MTPSLSGIIPPMITPLKEDGQLDDRAVYRLVEHLVQGGVNGIFVLGTAGEGPALDSVTRLTLIECATEAVAGRVPVLVGCMAVSTRLALQQIEEVAAFRVGAAVVSAPFYYGTNDQEILLEHFRELSRYSPLPLVIYNIPQTTHSFISPETIAELAKLPNIVAVKDSTGDLDHLKAIITLCSGLEFRVFQGSENALVDSLALGIDGLVPGSANIAPTWLSGLYNAMRKGDIDKALQYQDKVLAYREGCYSSAYWLSALKGAAAALGLCEEYCTHPIPSLIPEQRAKIRSTLKDLGILSEPNES